MDIMMKSFSFVEDIVDGKPGSPVNEDAASLQNKYILMGEYPTGLGGFHATSVESASRILYNGKFKDAIPHTINLNSAQNFTFGVSFCTTLKYAINRNSPIVFLCKFKVGENYLEKRPEKTENFQEEYAEVKKKRVENPCQEYTNERKVEGCCQEKLTNFPLDYTTVYYGKASSGKEYLTRSQNVKIVGMVIAFSMIEGNPDQLQKSLETLLELLGLFKKFQRAGH